jgi:hypothetical protein
MAINEESRFALHSRLEEVLGHDEAVTLMEYLPPVGWADVATKRDLDHLEVATKGDLARLELDLERLESGLQFAMARGFQRIMVTMISTFVAMGGLLVAAIKL